MNETPDTVLVPDDPAAFTVVNENGKVPLLRAADHAGKESARQLGLMAAGFRPSACETAGDKIEEAGAGEGNRTLVLSMGGSCLATRRHPRFAEF